MKSPKPVISLKEVVSEILHRQGLSQADLARKLEISPQSLNVVLNKGNPQLSTLKDIASALGVTPASLLAEEPATSKVSPENLQQRVECLERLVLAKTEKAEDPEGLHALVDQIPPDSRKIARSMLEAVLSQAQAEAAKKRSG